MNKSGLLVVIAGPSGVGKGTVRKEVMKVKDLNLVFSISLTTRKIRKGEVNGVDYYFISEDEFLKAIKNNDLLEYNHYVNNYYGTSKEQVNKIRAQGKNVMLEIDVNGARNIFKSFKKDELVTFFIVPPSLEELEKRIRGRSTESDEVIKARLDKAKEELNYKDEFDYVIVNDDVNRASQEIINKLKEVIKARG